MARSQSENSSRGKKARSEPVQHVFIKEKWVRIIDQGEIEFSEELTATVYLLAAGALQQASAASRGSKGQTGELRVGEKRRKSKAG